MVLRASFDANDALPVENLTGIGTCIVGTDMGIMVDTNKHWTASGGSFQDPNKNTRAVSPVVGWLAIDRVLDANDRQSVIDELKSWGAGSVPPLKLVDGENGVSLYMDFTRNGGATYWGEDGKLHTAGPDVLRKEYDPATGLFRGYLIEGTTATNLLPTSDETRFSAFDGSPTTDAAVSSAGSPVENLHPTIRHVVGGDLASSTLNVTSGSQYVLSVLLKPVTGASGLRVAGNIVPTAFEVYVDAAGTVTTAFATQYIIDAYAADVGGGWFWLSVVFEATSTFSGTFYIRNGGEMYFGALQAEVSQGGIRTSYTPTSGAAVTRAADVFATKNLDWYSDIKGSLIAEIETADMSNYAGLAAWGYVSYNAGYASILYSTFPNEVASRPSQANGPVPTLRHPLPTNLSFKVALTWGSGSLKLFLNGALVDSTSSFIGFEGTPATHLVLGMSAAKLWFRRVHYLPNVLTDAQAIAETTL